MEKKVNRILALLFVVSIFLFGGITLFTHGVDMAYATFVSYRQYLSTDSDFYDNIDARIKSLTNSININLPAKSWFEQFNAQLQLSLGKQMLSFGNQNMVRLKTGQLYDVQADADVSDEIKKLAELHERLSEQGIPMIFVYLHSELYESDMLPEGIDDYNSKVADDIVNGLRDAGIQTIDSREVYRETGLTLDESVYRTDNHCAMPLNFAVYRELLATLGERSDIAIDPAVSDPANFDFTTYPASHMASLGRRVGARFIAPDDYVLITPKFNTLIHEKLLSQNGYDERSGTYQSAVLNLDILDQLALDGYTNMYDITGEHRAEATHENPAAAQGRLLIVKDSFGTPTASMLSLAVRDTLAIDLRKMQTSVDEYVQSYQPDAVVILHCQEMMRDKNYVFVNQKNEADVK